MKTSASFIPFLLLAVLLFTGCKRTDGVQEYVGPKDTTTPTNFSVEGDSIRPRYSLVNFAVQKEFFIARFSHAVSWKLEIRGKNSGAVRLLSGVSQNLDSSNTAFDGKADSLAFFLPTENCTARLTVAGWTKEYTCEFVINQMPSFDAVLIDDFESPNDSTGFCVLYKDPTDSLVMFKESESILFFEGRRAMKMDGYDVNDNYWLSTLSTKNVNLKSILAGKEASSVYLNMFAKGETDGHTALEIQMFEDEDSDGLYSSASDELWTAKTALTGDWKQVSLHFDDFTKSGTSGNSTLEPEKLLRIAFVLVVYPQGGYSSAYVDYANFTFGQPFSQR
jgi:hypothetical protein